MDKQRVERDRSALSRKNPQIGNSNRQYSTHSAQKGPLTQAVRVSEGLWATLKSGYQIPVVSRQKNPDGTVTESIKYKTVTKGFQVKPNVSGNNVTLDIRPHRMHTTGGGKIKVESLQTTVHGKLGEWISLGGTPQENISTQAGINYSTGRHSSEVTTMYVKVEAL